MNKRPFAVFDIDGTIVRWQFFHAVVAWLAEQGHIPKHVSDEINQLHMTWKVRARDDAYRLYEQTLVRAFLESLPNIDPDDYTRAVDEVFDQYRDQVYIYTREKIRELKEKGYLLFAISGSQQEIVDKLQEYYGFDAAVGSVIGMEDGRFTGKLVSVPHRDKRAALETLVNKYDADWKGSYAFGDSNTDIPMLESVDNPVAFNPDKSLYEAALTRGWTIVIERKSIVYTLEKGENGFRLVA